MVDDSYSIVNARVVSHYLESIVPNRLLTPSRLSHLESLNPELGTDLSRLLFRHLKNNPTAAERFDTFCHVTMNDPNHSFEEWCAALSEFDQWLEDHERHATLEDMIGYASCCGEMSTRDNVSLDTALREALRQFGFEGKDK